MSDLFDQTKIATARVELDDIKAEQDTALRGLRLLSFSDRFVKYSAFGGGMREDFSAFLNKKGQRALYFKKLAPVLIIGGLVALALPLIPLKLAGLGLLAFGGFKIANNPLRGAQSVPASLRQLVDETNSALSNLSRSTKVEDVQQSTHLESFLAAFPNLGSDFTRQARVRVIRSHKPDSAQDMSPRITSKPRLHLKP